VGLEQRTCAVSQTTSDPEDVAQIVTYTLEVRKQLKSVHFL
jgi:hypothetical protein